MRERGLSAIHRYANRPMTKQVSEPARLRMQYPVIAYALSKQLGDLMTAEKPLRILVVDDSTLYRKTVKEILAGIPIVQIVGSASTGRMALRQINSLRPDLLILDVEMPEMNGLKVLEYIAQHDIPVGAIMLSSFTNRGSQMTLRALELGAFDFIPKPLTGNMELNKRAIKDCLVPMLIAFDRHRKIRQSLGGSPVAQRKSRAANIPAAPAVLPTNQTDHYDREIKIVVIGISTGGPQALSRIVREIPLQLGVPIAIVQHMPPIFTRELANRLDSQSGLSVKEAEDGESVLPNTIYIAPGGRQMKIVNNTGNDTKHISITDDLPENNYKPSANYLFRSVADLYGRHAIGVIMTGMGSDGMLGLRLMKRQGATIIAQDPKTCVVYGMPRGPIEAGLVDAVVPLHKIAQAICDTMQWTPRKKHPQPVGTQEKILQASKLLLG